jgi:hypothetical protein
MTVHLSKPVITQLRQALKDCIFREAYKHMHEHDLFRRKSRKKLLMISLAYGSLVAYLISLAI